MKLPAPRRLCVIGAGDSIKNFLSALAVHRPANVVVVSDEILDAAWSSDTPPIRQRAGELGATFERCSASDAAALEAIIAKHRCNVGMVLRWRAIFPKSLLQRFDGRLFNYHPTPLPRFRGAGGGSWEVLNDERTLSVTVHQMSDKVDGGPILAQFSEQIDDPRPTPASRNAAGERLAVAKLFPRVAQLLTGDELDLTPQEESLATYFPMLFTPRNGFLDLSWSAQDIDRFVRAFGPPHPGASVRYGDRLLRVTSADIVSAEAEMHPLCQGLIVNVTDSGPHVACNRGVVRFTEVRDEAANVVGDFRVGNRFYTTPDDLLQAKLYRHSMPKR